MLGRMVALMALTSALTTATVARAEAPPDPGPPPAVKGGGIASANMSRLYNYVKGGTCLLKLESLDDQIKRMPQSIEKVTDAGERATLDAYWAKLKAYLRAGADGVPGYGTWDELEKKRVDELAWLEANAPKPQGTQKEQLRAFAAAAYAYNKRATEQNAFAKAVLAGTKCQLPKYRNWVSFTDAAEIQGRIQAWRKPIYPSLDFQGPRKLVAADEKASYTRLPDLASAAREAASLYAEMGKQGESIKVLTTWAEVLGGASGEQIKKGLAEYDQLRTQVASVYAKRLAQIAAPPAGGGGTETGIAKPLIKGAVMIRPTEAAHNVSQEQHDEIVKDGKKYLRTWTEEFQTFGIYYVTKTKPYEWMVDAPGTPIADVCTLWVAGAFKYKKGMGVKLGTWLVAEENVIAPILCANASKTFAP